MPVLPENQNFKTYQVRLGGQLLKLKSNHDAVTFDEIVRLVESQLQRASQSGNRQAVSVQKSLILSCLNVAEELVGLKRELLKRLEHLEQAAQKLFSKVKSSSPALSK